MYSISRKECNAGAPNEIVQDKPTAFFSSSEQFKRLSVVNKSQYYLLGFQINANLGPCWVSVYRRPCRTDARTCFLVVLICYLNQKMFMKTCRDSNLFQRIKAFKYQQAQQHSTEICRPVKLFCYFVYSFLLGKYWIRDHLSFSSFPYIQLITMQHSQTVHWDW